jgi:hypothetical protein
MNFASLMRARWLPLLLASLLALVAGQAAAQLPTKPGKYGRTLIADVVLAPSQIDKFQALLDTLAATAHGSQNSVMFGDTADWVGDPFTANSTTNPYTIVVSVEGTAKAAGDVVTTWKSGWKVDTGASTTTLMHGLSAFDVKAGEHVTMTAAAAPSRFDRDKTVSPMLSLVDAKNVAIGHVQVQVWSGVGEASWLQLLSAWRFLIFGVVMLGVVLVFRRI